MAGTAARLDSQTLKSLNLTKIQDLDGAYPGLNIANNQGNIEVWIRGVGSSNNSDLGVPAAATHMDGIYVPRPSGFGSAFFDIQRVEVNFGPQGTLRGRQAMAGSVNVIPFKPGLGVFDAMVEVGYGSYNEKTLESVVNLPVSDNSAFRLAYYQMKRDSYYSNASPEAADIGLTGVEKPDLAEAADNTAFRASYYIEPTERLSATLHMRAFAKKARVIQAQTMLTHSATALRLMILMTRALSWRVMLVRLRKTQVTKAIRLKSTMKPIGSMLSLQPVSAI